MTAAIQPVPYRHHRFHLLDALRGVAAVFVVLFHVPPVMASSLAGNGQLAVDFFFCLSGFVVAFSYERRLQTVLSFKDFTVVRAIRLYPLYAMGSVVGLAVAVLVEHFAGPGIAWPSLLPLFALALLLWPTRLSTLQQADNFPLNNASWSLFYEVFANLAYALLIKFRIARSAVLLMIVFCSLLPLLADVLRGATLGVGSRQADFAQGFARVSLSFFLGVLLCRLYRSQTHFSGSPLQQALLAVLVTAALIVILISPLTWMQTEAFRLLAITLCFPALVYAGAFARLPHPLVPAASALGELSYPLYLLNMPLVSLLKARHVQVLAATHPALAHETVFAVTLALVAISFWIGKHLDAPLRRALTQRFHPINARTVHA